MKKLLFVFLISFFFVGNLKSSENSTFQNSADTARDLLTQAEEAYFQHNLELSKELLTKALNSNPSADERATAEQRLATLSWRFYRQYQTAGEQLARAEATKAKTAETLLEKARMETALGKYDAAFSTVKQALLESKDEREREQAIIGLAIVVESEVLKTGLDNSKAINFKQRSRLTEAHWLLLPIVKNEPGQLTPSRLLFSVSLLLDDGANALMAWRSYYHFQDNAATNSILSNAYKKIEDVLTKWKKPNNSRQNYENLVTALADSRMFDEAALIARILRIKYKRAVNDRHINEIIEYSAFCRQTQKITNEYYRQLALKKGDPEEYKKQLAKESEIFWKRINWLGNLPAFSQERFAEEMDKRFGALINLGITAGNLDLHMGHRVIDEERVVSQYNRTAKIRFISLDSMISNGFQSWAWDGRAQHGGWATSTEIIQVRPAYGSRSLRAWRFLSDPAEKKKVNDEIAKDIIANQTTAQANKYAFLPGLQKTLLRQGQEQLLIRLQKKGLTGNELKLAYLSEYEKAEIESSIFSHEGRHAIDAALKLDLTNDEKEFRAKLSQVVFASDPRLTLDSIFDANIGDNTPHGIANLNIMKGLVRWMEENKNSIPGLDSSKPILPQFDLLTDEQIRTAFRSMDPFFKGEA